MPTPNISYKKNRGKHQSSKKPTALWKCKLNKTITKHVSNQFYTKSITLPYKQMNDEWHLHFIPESYDLLLVNKSHNFRKTFNKHINDVLNQILVSILVQRKMKKQKKSAKLGKCNESFNM